MRRPMNGQGSKGHPNNQPDWVVVVADFQASEITVTEVSKNRVNST